MPGKRTDEQVGGRASSADATDPAAATRGDRDVLALAIGLTAIVMFVCNGANVIPRVVGSLQGIGLPPDRILSNALILNIALIIFGLRRNRDLAAELAERRQAEAKARELAELDPLTGCLNRRSIGAATDALIAQCAESGECVGFVMIDVDNFKRINDANGHSAGDAVLQACASRIAALLPPRGLLARLGGDEFACVVPFAAAAPSMIEDLVARITTAAAKPVELGRTTLDVTLSVGLARSDMQVDPDRSVDSQALLHMADIAMYQAKKSGRNRYCWFEPAMENALRLRNELEQGLRAGIEAGEFVPYYEQQLDLNDGTIIGFEMLARWQSPQFGLVGPEVFIPIAEETGLIADLSERLIRQALADAREWDPRLRLSVNISPVQLRDPWFAQRLLKLLVEANFPPSRLEVEVTESCLHENIVQVRSLLASLKNQGVAISLDDFGSGYSSLSQLHSLPFDRLKIDRSFVTPMADNRDRATIVQAITSLGEGLGLPVTAEGVETAEIVDHLKQLGQFQVQGYLYGHPEPASATRQRLATLGLLRPNGGAAMGAATATPASLRPDVEPLTGAA